MEYYYLQSVFDKLYADSKRGEVFTSLMDIIRDENNIRLAYRNIKRNTGSNTAGVDGITIKDIEKLNAEKYVEIIRRKLAWYKPKPVRRKEIAKPNGGIRPLGIPSMTDRLVQQCILQVLEPICEAKFHERSNGFRPNRSAEHALAQCYKMIQQMNLHYVVDVDIKGFFDNVNHAKLIKQMWTLGIRDKQLICIIKEMLKAPVAMQDGSVIYPDKGTPQGGILSPLLANIVLNELDMSRAEYDSMLEKTYAPENAEALKSALGKLEERKREIGFIDKPVEYFAVRQESNRKFSVYSISVDGLTTVVKQNMTSIVEAKKAMLEIFEQRKEQAKVELVHPQTLDEISAKMYKEHEQLPDVLYRITLNPERNAAETHILQEYVKNDEGKYSVGQAVVKGDYEKCNKFLAQLMSAPKIEPPAQTFEIYQLKSGDEMHGLRFMPYEFVEKSGSKPAFANYEKVYEGNAADLSGTVGSKLESLFEKFNLDRPEDFKGHSLSVYLTVIL